MRRLDQVFDFTTFSKSKVQRSAHINVKKRLVPHNAMRYKLPMKLSVVAALLLFASTSAFAGVSSVEKGDFVEFRLVTPKALSVP